MSCAVITGGGSGVGRATALMLAARGWQVAVLGRRADALEETRTMAGSRQDHVLALPCDVGVQVEVERAFADLTERYPAIDVLVNAAGTNTPARSLAELSLPDYHQLIDTNLNGAYYCVRAVLPLMRQRGAGTIVNVVSDAGLRANAKAGVAYVVSKFGMAGLTQSINAEERGNGIRASAIYPGDINTELLERRPVPPPLEARTAMLQAEDVAECVLLAITLPARAIIEELVVRPA